MQQSFCLFRLSRPLCFTLFFLFCILSVPLGSLLSSIGHILRVIATLNNLSPSVYNAILLIKRKSRFITIGVDTNDPIFITAHIALQNIFFWIFTSNHVIIGFELAAQEINARFFNTFRFNMKNPTFTIWNIVMNQKGFKCKAIRLSIVSFSYLFG